MTKLKGGRRPKTQWGLASSERSTGETLGFSGRGTEPHLANRNIESPASTEQLMEEILDRANMMQAFKRVRSNKGAPGVVGALPASLRRAFPKAYFDKVGLIRMFAQ